jgi:hypothetical protein
MKSLCFSHLIDDRVRAKPFLPHPSSPDSILILTVIQPYPLLLKITSGRTSLSERSPIGNKTDLRSYFFPVTLEANTSNLLDFKKYQIQTFMMILSYYAFFLLSINNYDGYKQFLPIKWPIC